MLKKIQLCFLLANLWLVSACSNDSAVNAPIVQTPVDPQVSEGEEVPVFESANIIRSGQSLLVSWREIDRASSYKLYISTTQEYSEDVNARVIDKVVSPFRLTAAFNEYTNHYFTIVAVAESVPFETPYRALSTKIRAWSEASSRGCAAYQYSVWCFSGVGFVHESNGSNIPIPDIKNPVRLEVQNEAACILDGSTLKCWSENDFTHLIRQRNFWENVTDFTLAHTVGCYIREGRIFCWGYGPNMPRDIPTHITNAQRIFSDSRSTYCATSPEDIVCWGKNDNIISLAPSLAGVTQIAIGDNHACAISQGQVICWGDDTYDQLSAPDMSGVRQVIATRDKSCATHDAGVSCWGGAAFPVDEFNYAPPTNLSNQAYGLMENDKHGVCVLDDGMPRCWGDKTRHVILQNEAYDFWVDALYIEGDTQCTQSQLENGKTRISCYSNIEGLHFAEIFTDVSYFDLGYKFGCALADNQVRCWGASPTIPKLVSPTHLAVYHRNVCVLDEGRAKCWGFSFDQSVMVMPLDNPVDLSLKYGLACAIDQSGLVCWTKDGEIEPQVSVSNPKAVKGTCVQGDEGLSCFNSSAPYEQLRFVDAPNLVDFLESGKVLKKPDQVRADIFTLKYLENAKKISATQSQDVCVRDDRGFICAGYNYYFGSGWRFSPSVKAL